VSAVQQRGSRITKVRWHACPPPRLAGRRPAWCSECPAARDGAALHSRARPQRSRQRWPSRRQDQATRPACPQLPASVGPAGTRTRPHAQLACSPLTMQRSRQLAAAALPRVWTTMQGHEPPPNGAHRCVYTRHRPCQQMRGLSPAVSAAAAVCDHLSSWMCQTPQGDWVSMGVASDGRCAELARGGGGCSAAQPPLPGATGTLRCAPGCAYLALVRCALQLRHPGWRGLLLSSALPGGQVEHRPRCAAAGARAAGALSPPRPGQQPARGACCPNRLIPTHAGLHQEPAMWAALKASEAELLEDRAMALQCLGAAAG